MTPIPGTLAVFAPKNNQVVPTWSWHQIRQPHIREYEAGEYVLYDILGSPQSRDLGHDNLEFQVVARNLEIDMRLVSPPDGHSGNTGSAATTARCLRNVFDDTLWHRDIYRCIKLCGIV